MKLFSLMLLILPMLVSCGKEKLTTETQQMDLSALSATGIEPGVGNDAQGKVVGYRCQDGKATNQARINSLNAFKNTIGIGNANTLGYTVLGVSVPTYKMEQIILEAINKLQTADPNSTVCPAPVLSATTV